LGLAVIIGFAALFIWGVPVVYAVLIPSIVYVLIEDLPPTLLASRVVYALDSFPLVAVPVFIFVGNLMNLSGITDRIFRFASTLAGRLHGGLAQVNILASLIFSGISGAGASRSRRCASGASMHRSRPRSRPPPRSSVRSSHRRFR
jgi:TRAP-type mannitol/chloroaromatic compound transport system permease large subunit